MLNFCESEIITNHKSCLVIYLPSFPFLAGKVGLQLNYMNSFRQIRLNIGEVKIDGVKSSSTESYRLQVDAGAQSIAITGQSQVGVYYGIQSLLSLDEPDGIVPHLTINDAPRYKYRGMELDVGRNFMPKSEVLKLIDAMAMYKLNKFHFHLTDDEGWRLEIPGLPELTEVRKDINRYKKVKSLIYKYNNNNQLYLTRVTRDSASTE